RSGHPGLQGGGLGPPQWSRLQSAPGGSDRGAGMASGAEERIRELTQRMLRRKLYVVFSTATGSPERIKETLPLHLEYMIGLERKGIVFASGPLTTAGGEARGDGTAALPAARPAGAR